MPPAPDESNANPPRPKSNWAQVISAATSLATLALAIYAIFFSSTSQTLVQYLQSELSYRNQRITTLENIRDELSRNISIKEDNLKSLDNNLHALQSTISLLEMQKTESVNSLDSLKREQDALSRSVAEARSQSNLNQFAYMKERIISASKGIMIVTWPLTMGEDENRTRIRRETLWPQYLDFYKKTARNLPSGEQSLAHRVVDIFERRCNHFSKIVFEIPIPRKETGPNFERIPDARIDEIRKRAFKVQAEMEECLRALKDE